MNEKMNTEMYGAGKESRRNTRKKAVMKKGINICMV